ncbi:nitroreductase [Streptomyces sp. A3M-1-3]|uniref:nitroreductase n=1 Tax=Streptomyces sp. A3M-1-3 TaxID=2962044 RepID=UPI0020B6E152|nr:nitroreductase [Streptomyces sp. A3M-1-3]MCP3820640.1 nitroreductase [Streptomyces sp. A3M-1-3]
MTTTDPAAALARARSAEEPGPGATAGPAVTRWPGPVQPLPGVADPTRVDLGTVLRRALAAQDRGGRLRALPSAGALHPVNAHVLAGPGCSVPPGRYAYDPLAHRLLRRGPAPADAPAGAVVVLTVTARRTESHYAHRAWPLLLLDTGHAVAALALAGAQALCLDADASVLSAAADLPATRAGWPDETPEHPLAAAYFGPRVCPAPAGLPAPLWDAVPSGDAAPPGLPTPSAPGPTGSCGPPALSGPSGLPDLPGASGSPGSPGPTGGTAASSRSGSTGLSRPYCSTDANGRSGPTGSTGASGLSGVSARPGPSGPSGATGSWDPTGPIGPVEQEVLEPWAGGRAPEPTGPDVHLLDVLGRSGAGAGTWQAPRSLPGTGAARRRSAEPPLNGVPRVEDLRDLLVAASGGGPGPRWCVALGGPWPGLLEPDPGTGELRRLASGDARPTLAVWGARQHWIAEAGAVLLAYGCPDDASPRRIRQDHLTAGIGVGLAQAAAGGLGLATRAVGSWQEADLGAALGGPAGRDWVIHALAIGTTATGKGERP